MKKRLVTLLLFTAFLFVSCFEDTSLVEKETLTVSLSTSKTTVMQNEKFYLITSITEGYSDVTYEWKKEGNSWESGSNLGDFTESSVGSFKYFVKAKSGDATATDSITIKVEKSNSGTPLSVDLTTSKATVTKNEAFTLKASSIPSNFTNISYQWKRESGSWSSGNSSKEFTESATGDYKYYIKVISGGDTATDLISIKVSSSSTGTPLSVNLTTSNSSVSTNESFTLKAEDIPNDFSTISYEWKKEGSSWSSGNSSKSYSESAVGTFKYYVKIQSGSASATDSVSVTVTSTNTGGGDVRKPFPQELDFAGCIKPSVGQSTMNSKVTALFTYYKNSYLSEARNTPNGYYIAATGNGGGGSTASTISEAHGYGMMIFALMAGYDDDAQKIFNGMYAFAKDHPSERTKYNMSWVVDKNESTTASSAATDGDMDIAYALLLAHTQWGSNGSVNYLQEAKDRINLGIKKTMMGPNSHRIYLGDWQYTEYNTRSSDWMAGHLRAYAEATGNSYFDDAADTVYSLVQSITDNYSPNTGLMPDFITGTTPRPDPEGGGTGEKDADKYAFNACRFPWRIAADYAHYGKPEAKEAAQNIISWLKSSTGGSTWSIKSAYTLDGSSYLYNYQDIVFMAPFTAGAIVDSSNQSYLNSLWGIIADNREDNEYAVGLNLLSMLLISGNWWPPVSN